MPFTKPLVETMVAIAALLLFQTPPPTELESVVVPPAQSVAVPVILPAVADELTVTVVIAIAVPQELETV